MFPISPAQAADVLKWFSPITIIVCAPGASNVILNENSDCGKSNKPFLFVPMNQVINRAGRAEQGRTEGR